MDYEQIANDAKSALAHAGVDLDAELEGKISTLTLLSGLLKEEDSLAASYLTEMRGLYSNAIGEKEGEGDVDAKELMASAANGSRIARCNHIGAEHLLYAILSLPECEACRALAGQGYDLDELKRDYEDFLVQSFGL